MKLLFVKYSKIILVGLAMVLCYACTLENENITTSPTATLNFSSDTIFFDTVFTETKTITRRLTVYNRNKNAVIIDNIRIGKGTNSPYHLLINGEETNQKDRLQLRGNDSILILISAKLNTNSKDLPNLVRDSVLFTTNNNIQHVKIWAWGQDVNRQNSLRITTPTVWSGIKPYMVADSLLVFENGSLTIEAGTTVYMNLNAKMVLQGKLTINGTCDKPVRILGIRNDATFGEVAGQWQGLQFTVDSKGAEINFAEIKNADIGLRVAIFDSNNTPDVIVRNSKIENMTFAGILAIDSDILLQNVLISNCFNRSFDVLRGGNYTIEHCTFVNFDRSPAMQTPTIRLQNYLRFTNSQTMMQGVETSPLMVRIENSIIWGTFANELFIDNVPNIAANITMNNNLLRTAMPNQYGINNFSAPNNQDFSNEALRFVRFNWQNRNYKGKELFGLDSLSPAIDKGKVSAVNNDMICMPRDTKPDIGAYERKK
jgi:hypothetical protein